MAEKRTPRGHGGRGGPQGHGFQRPQNLKGTVKKLMGYIGRYKALLVVVAVCLVLSSLGNVAASYLLKPAINDYIIPGDFKGLFRLLVLMGAMFGVAALCSYAYSRIMVRIAQQTVATLPQDLFDKLQTLPLRYFDTHQSGDLMSRFTNDIDTVSEMITSSLASILSNVVTFVCTIAMMLYLNWVLTLITFAFLALMLLVVKTIGARSRVSFQRQQRALGGVNGYIEEMIEGQKVIKVFNYEDKAIGRFEGLNEEYRQAATMAQTYAASMMPAMGNLSRIDYAVTCCVGGLLAIRGVFDVGSLGAYLLYVKQFSQPIAQISQQVNIVLAAMAGAERIFAVMDEQPEQDEGKTTIVRVEKNGDTLTEVSRRTGHWAWKRPDGELVELRGDVRFDHVVFGYSDEKIVLHDISLFAKPGQKIALVGSNEQAQTALFRILAEEIKPDSGSFKWGVTISTNYFPKDNSKYFDGCNLNMMQWFAQYSPEQLETYMRGFLGRMLFSGDDVYKPVSVLSGGEKVRVMLSRMMLSGANFLMLDQPTNHLDLESITAVNNALINFPGNVIFTSQDHQFITTIADRIIEIKPDGTIADYYCGYEDYLEKIRAQEG